MFKKLFAIAAIAVLLILLFSFKKTEPEAGQVTWWEVASIDTMKYSRDVAREKLNDPTFDEVIDRQISDIAETGATHVAIATPYDEEFNPFLRKWVKTARKNDLKVWFRGNFSGWEGWFGYPKISRDEHIKKTEEFVLKNKNLFEDGDIFTPCPECENGGPGDPRHNGDLAGHRKFLIDEYRLTKNKFKTIGKDVSSNFISMNGDVAKLVMDRPTTSALDGIVTIDHYVGDPEQLSKDIVQIAQSSGGRIVLGEFGAPIPDIHGAMSEKQQAEWINEALLQLVNMDEVMGINYWTNSGSSSQLWGNDGAKREAADTLKSFYAVEVTTGEVEDEAGQALTGVYIFIGNKRYFTDSKGIFAFPRFASQTKVVFEAPGYKTREIDIDSDEINKVTLKKEVEDSWFKTRKFVNNILNNFK